MSEDRLLNELLDLVPKGLRGVSGSLLYSGRDAFTGSSDLYLMGINPGGDPEDMGGTVAAQARGVLQRPESNFSAYRDEIWGNAKSPGTWKAQPRVLHLLKELGLNPGNVPTSNLVFVRSRTESLMPGGWEEECWPFHQAVIERLGIRVVVCFGKSVAGFVQNKVDAHAKIDSFTHLFAGRPLENATFRAPGGLTVVRVAHPSRSNWCNPLFDISPLVARALRAATT